MQKRVLFAVITFCFAIFGTAGASPETHQATSEKMATINIVIYNHASSGIITGWSVYDEKAESADGKKYSQFKSKTPSTHLHPGRKALWKVQMPKTAQAANLVLEYENGDGPRVGVAKLSFLDGFAGLEVFGLSPEGSLSVRKFRPSPAALPLSRAKSMPVQNLFYKNVPEDALLYS